MLLETQNRTAPLAKAEPSKPNHIANLPLSLAPLDLLLPLLTGVKRSGKGHTARCPAHQDKNASLAITAGTDGRVLLHCFTGCTPREICNALGLTVSDLFPHRAADLSPEGQQQLRQHAKQALCGAAAGMLEFESGIVLVAAGDVHNGRPISSADLDRLSLAARRIADARAVLK